LEVHSVGVFYVELHPGRVPRGGGVSPCPPRGLALSPLLTQLLCMAPSQWAGAPAAGGDANMPIPHKVIRKI
jgi:hypothetical protein